MTEPQRDPDPKIYAPFIQLLETQHPKLAAWLIGIGDAPIPHDNRKVAVTAHFTTPAGKRFYGTYHTEPSTAFQDAKEFLGVMVKKYAANCGNAATEMAAEQPAPPSEDTGDDEHDDPEPASP